MSLNTAHADHGVLIHAGEGIILFSDNVTVEFYGNDTAEFKGVKTGRMYLTTHRMIYNSKSNSDTMRSFSFPFIALQDVTVEQPMFSANYIKGKVRAQPNGNFIGEVKFKLTFKSGGAIEFGQAMLKAAHLASRHMAPGATPPPYSPPTGPWYAAPPPAYAPPPQGYYGWVPPYNAFPDQPPPNSVFVSDNPPPYPGVSGATYPAGAGFSGGPSPSPADAKAAEAAQSAYYDPNRPQTAYVPPPYNDQPPTYQESTSKKDN
ncbi:WW domain-binding protein 2 isoform X2 [Galleria mellonella]|uniref:Vacuolar protein-sorting-associated protein 36 n=1 Tax=Galleria mellonella TaxID=7137 RepID=A0A6J1X7F0_GALME|nr:WW domain-binding protein 2 isoform X2 [Galleria mellonella]